MRCLGLEIRFRVSKSTLLFTSLIWLTACTKTERMPNQNPPASRDSGFIVQDASAPPRDAATPPADAGSAIQLPDIGTAIPGQCEDQPTADAIPSEMGSINGSSFLYTRKADAKGLLLMFHGGGGSMEDNFSGRIEAALIARAADARGFALASLNSAKHLDQNRQDNKWEETAWVASNPASNQDVSNAVGMIDLLRGSLNAVPAQTPIFLIGISNGGTMASNVAQAVDAAAAVTYISNSKTFKQANATVPPLLVIIGENDSDNMKISAQTIKDLHPEVQILVNPPKPVMPGIFTRIPNITCEESKEIGTALDSIGWLDANGMLNKDPKDRSASPDWTDALPAQYRNGSAKEPFQDVMVERYAGHSPSSDWNNVVFDFFEAQLP